MKKSQSRVPNHKTDFYKHIEMAQFSLRKKKIPARFCSQKKA